MNFRAPTDDDDKLLCRILSGELPSTPESESERAEREAAFLAKAIRQARTSYFYANCPPEYQNFDPHHPTAMTHAPQIAQITLWRADNAPAKGLIATGPTGRCKSRAMFGLCKRLLCEESIDVGIWAAKDWFVELESSIRFGRDEADGFVRRTAARKVLFFDDYGQEAVSTSKADWSQGWFFRMLDLRVGNRLPLLITTNMTAKEISGQSKNITAHPLLRRLLDLAEPVIF